MNPKISFLDRLTNIFNRGQPEQQFDILIVGGGTAGCVLASRLSEDPNIHVLLIESGRSSDILFSRIPAGFSLIFHSKDDYDLYTTPQSNAGGAHRYWPRAKLLGGCSTINAMMFNYGAPSDYDEWAEILGDSKDTSPWSYKNLHKYFLKFEKYAPHRDFPSVDTSFRGSSGPVEVGYAGHYSPLTRQFLESCEAVGIPLVPDVNTPKGALGASKTMTYIDSSGRRVTALSAYLTSDVLKRPNLKVIVDATVTKILFDHQGDRPRVIGVEYAQTKEGPRFKVEARKEVILAAGAVHTPQILMISGVGPEKHLRSHDIPVVAHIPGVGAHLMDHLTVDVNLLEKGNHSLWFLNTKRISFMGALKSFAALLQWMIKGNGPLTCNIGEGLAFVRSSDAALFPPEENEQSPEDTSSGPSAPDIELFFSPAGYLEHGCNLLDHSFSVHGVLLRPTSLGTITLKSNDPFDKPIIDPNYLQTQHDVDILVHSLKILRRITKVGPLAESVDPAGSTNPMLDHHFYNASDSELVDFVRKKAETLYHPTSTARMSKLEDGGVVDGRLRVYGVEGLRVVDASIFPTIVAGHTTGPVLAVAELAADMIKEDFRAAA